MIIIFVALLILLHYIYMAVFPVRVAEINSVTLVGDVLEPGDSLVYDLDWCSYGQYPVTVNRRMVDGFVFTLQEYETSTPPGGCYDSRISTFEIPKNIPPGTYYMQVELVIHVNSIRNVIIEYESDSFKVVGE